MKLILFFLLVKTSLCFTQTVNENVERKMDSLFSEYNSTTAGVALAVVKDGEITFEKGYGMANLEYDVPITPKTVFHVASVSKQFTAFSVYLLEKQGKISFEDDIRKYIPELPDYRNPIKIKHLLAHTSGLRDQWAILTLAGWQLEDVITTEQILKLASKQKELNFETGTAFGYCNTGYTLLAETIERITGQSFAEFTKTNIFGPLGMKNTQFYDDFQKVLKYRAYSYEIKDEQFIKRELNYSNVGPTSLMTTVEDLAKWTSNFQNPKVGDAQLLKEFNKMSLLDNNKPVVWASIPNDTTYHAKGQLLWKYKGLQVISHGGHDAGFRAVMTRFPENGLSIIALSNNEHFQMLGKVLPIADWYLKDQFVETTVIENLENQNSDKKEKENYSNTLTDFVGKYKSDELTTQYKIKVRDEKLIMTHQRLNDIELTMIRKDKFSGINTFGFEMDFLRTGRKITGFEISNFGAKRVRFNKIQEQINNHGKDDDLGVKLVKQQLIAYNSRNLDAFLLPYSKNVEISNFPKNVYGKGIAFLKKSYGELFSESPNLYCEVLNRMVLGNTVIDHEKVSGLADLEPFEAIAIYKIENSKISRVYFIRKNE